MPPPAQAEGPLPPHLLSWLKGLSLSHPLRSVRRDFCSGFLVAEVLHAHYPADVDLVAFGTYGSLERKKSNWLLLEKLFKKGEIPIKQKLIQSVIDAEEGAAVKLLEILHQYLEGDSSGSRAEGSEAMLPTAFDSQLDDGDAPFGPQPLSWSLAEQQPAGGFVAAAAASPEEEGPSAAEAGCSHQAAAEAGVGPSQALSAPGSAPCAASLALEVPGMEVLEPSGYYAATDTLTAPMQQPVVADGLGTAYWPPPQLLIPGQEWATLPLEMAASPAACQLSSSYPYYGSPNAAAGVGEQLLAHQNYAMTMTAAPTALQPDAAVHAYGYDWQQLEVWQDPYYTVGIQQGSGAYIPAVYMQLASPTGVQPGANAASRRNGRAGKMTAALRGQQQQQQQQQRKHACRPGQPSAAGQAAMALSEHMKSGATAGAAHPAAEQAAAAGQQSSLPPAAAEVSAPQPYRIEYDKHPRPIDFKPYTKKDYTLKDYDVKQAKGYWELGQLGPDYFEDGAWRAKWEKLERQKAYGQAARAVNQQKAAEHSSPPGPRPKPPSSREKALEFAKRCVPKPAVVKASRAASAEVDERLSKLQLNKHVSLKDRGGLADMIRIEFATAEVPSDE